MGRPIRVVRPRRHRLRSADYRSRHRIQYRCCCCNSVDKTVTIASALSVTRDFGIDRLTTPVVGRCVCVCMNAGREGRRGGGRGSRSCYTVFSDQQSVPLALRRSATEKANRSTTYRGWRLCPQLWLGKAKVLLFWIAPDLTTRDDLVWLPDNLIRTSVIPFGLNLIFNFVRFLFCARHPNQWRPVCACSSSCPYVFYCTLLHSMHKILGTYFINHCLDFFLDFSCS